MEIHGKYRTRQREILLKYLEKIPGVHITANDVCEYFKNEGNPIGQATVYRQLESLVDEGLVNKYYFDAGSPACFEYMKPESHCEAAVCFHCKCEKCGRLIHLKCEELEELGGHLLEHHGFRLDPVRTVIYGVCDDCAEHAGD